MALITKKQIRKTRLWVLSDKLEQTLLLMYILCFLLVLIIKSDTLSGIAFRKDNLEFTAYQSTLDLKNYFLNNELHEI